MIEAPVSLQLTIHVPQPEQDAGAYVLQKAAVYSFKTVDLIRYLSRGKGYPFTAKARLVQRLSLEESQFFIVEKNVGELEVTDALHFDYLPQIAEGSLPFTINKKVVKKTKAGLYQYFSLGQFRVSGAGDRAELLIQGPLIQSVRQVVSKDVADANVNFVSQSVTGMGSVDLSGEEVPVSGIAQGSVKVSGHKVIRTPPDFKSSATAPKTANPYPPFYGFAPVKPVEPAREWWMLYLGSSVDYWGGSATQP